MPKRFGNDCVQVSEKLCNGSSAMAESHDVTLVGDLDMIEISEDSHSLPDSFSCDENGNNDDGNNFTPEIQQAYKIFQSFLLEKHKSMTAPFWFPIGDPTGNSMSFKKIDNKFVRREYESITDFVADFRLMLENCYRFHGVDHWISKQAQKLELLLEQKLTLLSRTLREKTTLAVTSRGRFGTEDEKATVGTSNRRRSTPRSLTAITAGGSESIMVQVLRLEEQQKAKVEKRQRDLEKKEAGEASVKEVEEWERSLLSLADSWPIDITWELPAIGHFLCLAQTALNLPEIVFFELERCLLMPRCSSFLAKVMTSLLCPPHRRTTLHRRPALAYRRWEAELRQKVLGWYHSVGRARDQEACAEQLGLCHRFFWTLGEASPLEEKPFHLLPFNQRVWLLKGLCDNVYETQKDIQEAVLGQPIHECRESILGYDSQENAYIHFPHFCGADLRIYCQSPCTPLEFPLPPFCVMKLEPKMLDLTREDLSACLEDGRKNPDLFFRGERDDFLQDERSGESELEQKGPGKFSFFCKEEFPSPESTTAEPMEVELELKEDEKDSDCESRLGVVKNSYTGRFPARSLSTDSFRASLLSGGNVAQNNRTSCQHSGPCSKCCIDSPDKPEPHLCFCFKDVSDSGVPQQTGISKAETGTVCSLDRRRKQRKERSLGLKKLRRTRAARSSVHKAAVNLKRKDKRKKPKLGRNFVPKKTVEKKEEEPPQRPVEPAFKLVCANLEELRILISKIEDELDELESIKKRCGRWCVKKDAVKELHITLIRLLNELLPWEPKLLKAFQRNRARLKKECDDFKKHLEYDNFVREELFAAEGEGDGGKEAFVSTEVNRELNNEEKLEGTLRGEVGETDCENHTGNDLLGCLIRNPDFNTALSESRPLTRSFKLYQSVGPHEDLSLRRKERVVVYDSVTPQAEDASRDQNRTGTNPATTERASVLTAPLVSVQRRCKPIQALLAKSVGNKVTLMSHPQAAVISQNVHLPNKTVCTALTSATPTVGHSSPQPTPDPVPHSASVFSQTQSVTTSSAHGPVQVISKVPEGLNSVRNDGTPIKALTQPVTDLKPEEKVMQQVIIFPTNLLIQKSEGTGAQQPSSTSPAITSKTATRLPLTPGFVLPENRIPVQETAPLKDLGAVATHSCADSPSSQSFTHSRATNVCKNTTETSSALKQPPASTLLSANPNKCDLKQELKTVCIRDSQSILVTTRGGNTGVVKVQTSEQSGASALQPSPIFTLPPQFQAFLVSKASATAPTAPTTQTFTTANVLPVDSTPADKGTSLSLKSVSQVNSSPLMSSDQMSGTAIMNNASHGPASDNATTNSQTFVGVNPILPPTFQTNAGGPLNLQNTAFKNITHPPQKRLQVTGIVADQSSFQKVFLVAPTTGAPALAPSITTTSTGSRVRFVTPSDFACSTLTVPKGSLTSESGTTAPAAQSAAEVMKVRPNLGQSTTATMTEVHGINISGLTARILNETTVANETLTQAATKVAPAMVSTVATRPFFVQTSQPVANSGSPVNVTGPGRATGFADAKTVVFTTYDTRHMASSALLSNIQQNSMPPSASSTVSISNILNNKSEPLVTSTAPNVACPVLGGIMNKGATPPRGLMVDKPWVSTSLSTASSVISPQIVNSLSGISPAPRITTATGSPSLASQSVVTPLARPGNAIATSTTLQEKLVINTTAPLAPGTQLLINNTRFVVPVPGLGPGSHVLLISGPAVGSTVPLGVPSGPRLLTPKTVTPGVQSQSVRLPRPTTTQARPAVPVQRLTAARPPVVCVDSTAVAQVTQLEAPVSSGQQSLMRLPSFLHNERRDTSAAPINSVANRKETVTGGVQSHQPSPSVVTPAFLQTGLLNIALNPHSQLTPIVTSVKTVTSPASRMQTLPVATVPPSGLQATCVSTVSPTVNKLIMATCQPVRATQAGNTRMSGVGHVPQGKVNTPAQVPGEQNCLPASKLLLSPDGAVLNVIGSPVLQSLPAVTSAITAGMVNSPKVLDTLESQRMLTSDH